MRKEYVIFAGVNGAGKSTLFNSIKGVPKERVSSDEILRENGGDWGNLAEQAKAMKEAVKRINYYVENGISFNQETTLTGHSIVRNIKRAKELGFSIKMFYVGLESVDLAVNRVEQRVKQGGHGIEENDIRRRYENSLKNLKKVIPVCDIVIVYDNTIEFTKVAYYENGIKTFDRKCEWLDKYNNGKAESI